jgi:hypothetical protein
MKCLKAIYWDTDSTFVQDLPHDVAAVNLMLAPSLNWLTENVVPVMVGDELGMLDFEMWEGRGFLAGTKRYYLEGLPLDKKTGEKNIKRATHGIPALNKKEVPRIIEDLATGKDTKYTSKERPKKAKESKRQEEIGSFESKGYTPKFHLDERLEWVKDGQAWIGIVKPFEEMGVETLSEADYQKHLEKIFAAELKKDSIKEAVLTHGYIKIINKDDRHFGEYERMTRSTKQKYFRRDGLPIDVFADLAGITINDLLEKLNHGGMNQ